MPENSPLNLLNDRMLSLAFRYRETHLWKTLNDTHIFALELSDGRLGRICIMGNAGMSICVGLYIGDEGFRDLLYQMTPTNNTLDNLSMSFSLHYLGCDYSCGSDIPAGEARIIRQYAKEHGLRIREKDGYPDFTKHDPETPDYKITTREDADAICEALEAALEVARVNEEEDLYGLAIKGFFGKRDTCGGLVPRWIPKLKKLEDGTFKWSKHENKQPSPLVYPEIPLDKNSDRILFDALRDLPREKTLQMRFVRTPITHDDPDTGKEIFPLILFCSIGGNALPPVICSVPGEKELELFCNHLVNSQSMPQTIEVEDDLTEAFVRDFCKKLNVKLVRKKELTDLLGLVSYLLQDIVPGFLQ